MYPQYAELIQNRQIFTIMIFILIMLILAFDNKYLIVCDSYTIAFRSRLFTMTNRLALWWA